MSRNYDDDSLKRALRKAWRHDEHPDAREYEAEPEPSSPSRDLGDMTDPRHSDRVTFLAFAKAARWDHDLATFKKACLAWMQVEFAGLLPGDPSLISSSLWVQAAEAIATSGSFGVADWKARHGCKDRPGVEKAKRHLKGRHLKGQGKTTSLRRGDWVTPRRWRSRRYEPWVKSVLKVEGAELVLYGNKRVVAVEMRKVTDKEKDAYFKRLLEAKRRAASR